MSERLRVAVVGTGIGRSHVEAHLRLPEQFELLAICDLDEAKGRDYAASRGGVLLSHAVHAIDILPYILGPARRVYARTATRVNSIEVEDCAAATIELASGALASLGATLGSPAEITRLRFSFSNLSAESNVGPYTSTGDPWSFTPDTPELAAQIEGALTGFEPQAEGYEGQFGRLAAALHQGDPAPITLADARVSLELVAAMYFSAQSGAAVELPIERDHPAYTGRTS